MSTHTELCANEKPCYIDAFCLSGLTVSTVDVAWRFLHLDTDTVFSRSIKYAVFESSMGNSTWSICPGVLAGLRAMRMTSKLHLDHCQCLSQTISRRAWTFPSPCDPKSRLVLPFPGSSNPEPFPGKCQAFSQTLQSTKLLNINVLGRSCPEQGTALSGPWRSGVPQARDRSSRAEGKVSWCSWQLQGQLCPWQSLHCITSYEELSELLPCPGLWGHQPHLPVTPKCSHSSQRYSCIFLGSPY